MMKQYFEIGGALVCLTAPEGAVEITGELAAFRVAEGTPDHRLHMEFADALEIPEEKPLFVSPERRVYRQHGRIITLLGSVSSPWLRLERFGDETRALAYRGAYTGPMRTKTVLAAMEAEHLVSRTGGVLLHASLIEHEGRAIAFTAPSGVGKSTQAMLWQQHRGARILNGDRCVLTRDAQALGVPFCGSSGICCPARLPLAAVVVLSQAPATAIAPLKGVSAFRSVWEGCAVHSWNRQDVETATETLSAILDRVPVFHLACTPDASAVLALEGALKR